MESNPHISGILYLIFQMSKQPIKYIAFFDTQDSIVKRNYVTSASNKLEYIARAIASTGRDVEIVSISQVQEEKFKFYLSEKKQVATGVTLRLPFSWGGNRGLVRKLKVFWHLANMFFFLLLNCKRNEMIIVYHSLGYFDIIQWAKKIRKFKLILEVEEVYSDVSQMSEYWRNLEFKMFDIADAFILSNDLLDAKINKHNKPSVVIYGTYQVEPKRVEKFNDGKIHVIYAGTFDPNKGGAKAAIMAAEYLPENYHIHICGFGNPEDVETVKNQVTEVQGKSISTITYDGLKKGNEFVEYLQQCHIGLSTQKPEGVYNDTSFPSKVLTYMANGLVVVSIKIPVLEKAAIAAALSFYEIPDGKSLSKAIMKTSLSDNREIVKRLDYQFKEQINYVLYD